MIHDDLKQNMGKEHVFFLQSLLELTLLYAAKTQNLIQDLKLLEQAWKGHN